MLAARTSSFAFTSLRAVRRKCTRPVSAGFVHKHIRLVNAELAKLRMLEQHASENREHKLSSLSGLEHYFQSRPEDNTGRVSAKLTEIGCQRRMAERQYAQTRETLSEKIANGKERRDLLRLLVEGPTF